MFYAGLAGWDTPAEPALYLIGYFEVEAAGLATDFDQQELTQRFGPNFHVRHPRILDMQRRDLVLVDGGPGSRLLSRAVRLSVMGRNRLGQPLKSSRGRCSRCSAPSRWLTRAGVPKPPGEVAHAFRHSYAKGLVSRAVPLSAMQALLGHAGLQTTQVYLG